MHKNRTARHAAGPPSIVTTKSAQNNSLTASAQVQLENDQLRRQILWRRVLLVRAIVGPLGWVFWKGESLAAHWEDKIERLRA